MNQSSEPGGLQHEAADYLRRRILEETQHAATAASATEAAQHLELAQAYEDRLNLLLDAMRSSPHGDI